LAVVERQPAVCVEVGSGDQLFGSTNLDQSVPRRCTRPNGAESQGCECEREPLIRQLSWASAESVLWPSDSEVHLWCLSESAELGRRKWPLDSRPSRGAKGVVSKHIVQQIISCYSGAPPGVITIAYGTYGKPHLNITIGRRQLHFNIAHCDTVSALCFAAAPVGIDVEDFEAVPESDAIGLRHFNAKQLRELQGANSGQLDQIFLRLWTETEAYLKALGCGISALDRNKVPEVLPDDWSTLSLESHGSFVGTILVQCHIETVSVYSEVPALVLSDHVPLSWNHGSAQSVTH
jgi:phosphopantetheinyl transferase